MEHKTKRASLGHLMVDIETMGESSNAVICSIGAVEFEINTGETRSVFYRKVDIQSCLDAGLIVDGATIKWWLRQNEEAQKEISGGGTVSIQQALTDFSEFISGCADTVKLWSNGKHFDISRLADAYKACRIQIPWKYYNVRDCRTLVDIMPEIKQGIQRAGIAHHALDDCLYQIKYCSAIWQYMNKNLVRVALAN
jgi:exodeoxyribonuclease VIII